MVYRPAHMVPCNMESENEEVNQILACTYILNAETFLNLSFKVVNGEVNHTILNEKLREFQH